MNSIRHAEVPKWIKFLIVIFYTVGIIGFLNPYTQSLFIQITPFAILLSAFLLSLFHSHYDIKQIIVFAVIYTAGFVIEAIGVNTGMIFGSYNYGEGLGLKIFETPLLIGINWLFLSYSSTSIAERISSRISLQLLIAPSLMLIYDLILEQLAPVMNMWSWQDNTIPFKNYMAWWLIGFVFVALLKLLHVPTKNPLSLIIFCCQFIFFLILYFVFNLLP